MMNFLLWICTFVYFLINVVKYDIKNEVKYIYKDSDTIKRVNNAEQMEESWLHTSHAPRLPCSLSF